MRTYRITDFDLRASWQQKTKEEESQAKTTKLQQPPPHPLPPFPEPAEHLIYCCACVVCVRKSNPLSRAIDRWPATKAYKLQERREQFGYWRTTRYAAYKIWEQLSEINKQRHFLRCVVVPGFSCRRERTACLPHKQPRHQTANPPEHQPLPPSDTFVSSPCARRTSKSTTHFHFPSAWKDAANS